MRSALVILNLLFLMLLTGCVYALHPYNTPSQQKLQIEAASPKNCLVQVANAEAFPVGADGRVMFDIPALPRGCDSYLFGVIKIGDGSPERVPAIHILRDGKIARKLSLQRLMKLPVDAEGYSILVLR